MAIQVKCFASLREQLGVDHLELDFARGMRVADAWARMTNQPPPSNLLCARNLAYVGFDQSLEDGDEVAFFPPVTGG